MAFCAKCGNQLGDSDRVCGNCGTPVAGPVHTGSSASSNDMLMGILAYLGVFALIPYLVKGQTAFVRAHAVRGMNLFLLEIIALIAVGIFS